MIYELMSKGTLAKLPDDMAVHGMPPRPSQNVLLLLPFNRYLLGDVALKKYERWTIGRVGCGQEREVFLYDREQKVLCFRDGQKVTLSADVVSELRAALCSQMPPPGEHLASALILRGLLKDESLFADDRFLNDEELMALELERHLTERMAYWAIRFALFRNDYESVSRVKTWLKSAGDVFERGGGVPKVWFSLADMPGRRDMEEMEALAFSLDDLQRMNAQSSRPVVLYSKTGYLMLSEFGGTEKELSFRIWMFLPAPLWNEMRERRKLSIREIVMASWGYLDGLEAEKERDKYNPIVSLRRSDS